MGIPSFGTARLFYMSMYIQSVTLHTSYHS